MDINFPYTEEKVNRLLKKFEGDQNFSVDWHWAPFHKTGMTALKWAAEKNMTVNEVYTMIEDLSCPVPPPHLEKRFSRAGLLDLDNRIWALNPAVSIEVTLRSAGETLAPFHKKKTLLLSIDDLLERNPEISTQWCPVFEEDLVSLEKWLSKERSLLKVFQELPVWNQLKVVESLVGVAKALSVLKFERITKN